MISLTSDLQGAAVHASHCEAEAERDMTVPAAASVTLAGHTSPPPCLC